MSSGTHDPAHLRRRAEERLARHAPAVPASEAEALHLVHELRVHEIELEMQNEALQQAEAQAQDALRQLAALNQTLEETVVRRTADLRAALDAAKAASRAKTAFLSNMSHELRTPLNGVIGMLEMARRRATDPKQTDWLGMARQSADHLLAVINDILDFSKIEAGQLQVHRNEFTLAPVLELLGNLMRPEVDRRGLRLDIEIDDALARRPLLGDSQRLTQVLINLAGNAVKFTDAGGVQVRVNIVQASPSALTLRFEVQDSGIGVALEDQARLFQPFQQIDDTSSRSRGGTGLGLALCARMVQLMGGQIGHDSAAGAGSTFWFSIPLETVAEADARVPPPQQPSALESLAAACAGRRVLMAEDNPINQAVLHCLLDDAGLVVDSAADGAAAVEMALANDYDLILMDVQLPVLSGIDATRAIRRAPTPFRRPIIALTANAFAEERAQCLEAGMDDHLAKPIEPELLYRTLLKWLQPA